MGDREKSRAWRRVGDHIVEKRKLLVLRKKISYFRILEANSTKQAKIMPVVDADCSGNPGVIRRFTPIS